MIFTETPLQGAFVIDLEQRKDPRGSFARTYCAREFEAHGLKLSIAQSNWAHNHKAGTLRGLHYQKPPAAETKLVRCTRGGVFDVIVDLRPDSPTYLRHFAVELTADNRRAIYIPQSFAHGYQTLTDDAELSYQVSEFYAPGDEAGLRYDDPALAIPWPLPVTVISDKDANLPMRGSTGAA